MKFNVLLTTVGVIVGIMGGSMGMWFKMKDRIEKEVEERVTTKITVETRLTRLEERNKQYKDDIWILKGKVESLQQQVNSTHK